MTTLRLLGTQLEVLRPLQRQMFLRLTLLTFQSEHNLPRCLGLLVEYRLRLSSETHLFGVVPALTLGEVGGFAGLVLRHLVGLVLAAFLAGAEGFAFLGYVDHL